MFCVGTLSQTSALLQSSRSPAEPFVTHNIPFDPIYKSNVCHHVLRPPAPAAPESVSELQIVCSTPDMLNQALPVWS